jgi:capsid protein
MSSPTSPTVPRFQRPRSMQAGEPRRLVLSASPGSYYDAASTGRENDWGPLRNGVFEDFLFTGSVRAISLSRFRREVRNNPYLAGLVAKYPEAVGNTSLRSRTLSKAYNLAKERFWYRWSKGITHDGRSLRRVEKILWSELLLAGELFHVKLRGGRVQLVASEFCGSPGGATRFGDREVNGIVYSADGIPTHYRFGRLSRWGSVEFTGRDDELVEARHVIHVFDSDRVLQGRGLPWLLASMKTARDLYEITRAKTKQIKDVTAITGAIEKVGADTWLQDIGEAEGDSGEPDSTATETADSPADKVSADKRPLKIELAPGTFVFLEPGEKLHQLVNEYKATDYKELIMLMLHAVATPVGLPVELWFSGLGDVNYSGFKGLGVQWKSRRQFVCDFIVEAFHEPLHDWRIALAHELGEITDIQTGRPIDDGSDEDELIEWGWKRAAVLDDEKAAKSNDLRLKSGESDLATIWAENGEFPEEVFARRRQLWIMMLVAAGELEPGGDHADVEVPRGFLLHGELPGTTTYPYLPSGTGTTEGGAEAAADPAQPAAPAATAPTEDNDEDDTDESSDQPSTD